LKMVKTQNKSKQIRISKIILCLLVCISMFLSGCIQPTIPASSYYGKNIVPQKQEFRWSDGGLPKVFDPTFAASPPDTDAVRAMYEGLTDYEPKTLKPTAAVAIKWEASDDKREWTFYLRQNARWSNGDIVTANDFVNSWQRVIKNRANAPHAKLMQNIVGAFDVHTPIPEQSYDPFQSPEPIYQPDTNETPKDNKEPDKEKQNEIGVEAVSDFILRVKLKSPDADFPELVAHPVFRPVHKNVVELNEPLTADKIVTNGAFELEEKRNDAVVIKRADKYWDVTSVALQKVAFIQNQNPESVLSAYRAGEIDAITNTRFEPLGLKLLTPYKDYRKETYAALTFYRFNTMRKPFDDIRVREALAISLDRERINQDALGSASEPAYKFLPFERDAKDTKQQKEKSVYDVVRAKQLLADAGFPQGQNFPKIRLLVNRNDQQKKVAQEISQMWKTALNVETEIMLKSWEDYRVAIENGDYDVARRGVVMQTTNESSNLFEMFDPLPIPATEQNQDTQSPAPSTESKENNNESTDPGKNSSAEIITEEKVLKDVKGIPIYFSSSYTLIKPYITGFDSNLLDAPSLKHVRIQTDWKEEKTNFGQTTTTIK